MLVRSKAGSCLVHVQLQMQLQAQTQSQVVMQVQMQQVRHRNKPRWLPIAPSKLFKIPVRPVIPPEDKAELFRLHTHYRTEMKAIRRLFVQEYKIEAMSIANLTSEKAKQEEEILFQKAMLENDKWNESVAKDRMIRLREEEAVRKATVLSEKLRKQALKEERLEKAAEELRQLQESAKAFITRENLDAAIEHALNYNTEYNYAITLKGEILGPAQQDDVPANTITRTTHDNVASNTNTTTL